MNGLILNIKSKPINHLSLNFIINKNDNKQKNKIKQVKQFKNEKTRGEIVPLFPFCLTTIIIIIY